MKKIIVIIFIAFAGLLTFSSCSKSWLDEKPMSAYSPTTLSDSLGFEASATGLYNSLAAYLCWSNNQGWLCVWQVGTDIAYSGQPEGIETPYYNYTLLNSTDGASNRVWTWCYQTINNCNVIIANVESPSLKGMTEASKKAIDGEARFFRAYCYNQLVQCFGKVPLVTKPITTPKTDFTRASVDSINALLVEDLSFGATNLPDIEAVKSNSKGKLYGRANKYQAMQLLAETYLRMNKNDLAEQQAQAIINSGQFSLTSKRYGINTGRAGDYYSDMFQYGNERRVQGNKEALWVLEQENPSSVAGGNVDNAQQRRVWVAAYYAISGMKICDSLGGRGLARLRLNNWFLYGLYPSGDMRNSQFNIHRTLIYNDPAFPATYGKPVPLNNADTIFRTCPYSTKWGFYDPKDDFGYATLKDFILMRLGETYLLLAEAQIKQGKTTDAANSINALRTRAQAPQVSAADMTMDFLLDERARELVGEENRRLTLTRTGTLVDRALKYNAVANPATYSIKGLTTTNLLMPIPQSQIDLNKDAKLEQNPGYN
ncbi:RagB/SusD family nutrient uptake outer membrane protein [Pinibacter aurantiacus]|uniref:RagB/SusD family nutrient uptake outer membrane protein n=1 Tax=Pinibacter aurantiacus TaxID=2851599 RepID=A0A9E2SAY8_9BACT|nr:RagB/SusD family nutrient uptake outer membrane protein [Pinibacter aurantiacus]MBV4359231.1 RagB/SusD family nutrient uptake outer membrane protein [Pinibacter aurantiacus]